jgi:hypothetical protein
MRTVRMRTAWSLTLPVLVAGETLVHSLTHRLVDWDEPARADRPDRWEEPARRARS